MADDLLRRATLSQHLAALAMLEACLRQCPDAAWTAPVGARPFWRVAYHALFYADFYMSPSEAAYRPQPWRRGDENFLDSDDAGPPLSRETLLAYAAHCRAKAAATIPAEDDATLAGPSGFEWLRIPRAETHLYNARHVQHHAGQLAAAVRAAGGEPVDWVGRGLG